MLILINYKIDLLLCAYFYCQRDNAFVLRCLSCWCHCVFWAIPLNCIVCAMLFILASSAPSSEIMFYFNVSSQSLNSVQLMTVSPKMTGWIFFLFSLNLKAKLAFFKIQNRTESRFEVNSIRILILLIIINKLL